MTASSRKGKVQLLGTIEHDDFVLEGKKLNAHLTAALTGASCTRSIIDASQLLLTVNDPERFLQRGRYFARRGDLEIDDLWFRLRAMDKQGDNFTLTLEDREVSMLRRHTKPVRASRKNTTRAQFLKRLVAEEPSIPFVCPELNVVQKIHGLSRDDQKTVKRNRVRGIALDATVELKDTAGTVYNASRGQIQILNRVLDVAQSLGAGAKAALAMVETVIVENQVSNSSAQTDHTSEGVFQVLASTASGLGISATDIEACARAFLTKGFYGKGGAISLAKAHPDWSAGQIAQACQGSAFPARYDQVHDQAQAIIDAYGGVDKGPTSDGTPTYVQQYTFARGLPKGPKDENTWECGQRLAKQVGWRFFCVAGVIYFISDYDLIRSQPFQSIDEDTKGIDSIDYTLSDSPKRPTEATVEARAARWACPPGTVVNMLPSMGAGAGAWIVTEIDRPDLFDDAVTITLGRPEAPQLEPTSTVASRSSSSATLTRDGGNNAGDFAAAGLGDDSHVQRAYDWCKRVDARHYTYVFGGGHTSIGVTTQGRNGPGYDCSGFVSGALHAGGMLDTPESTSDLISWGRPGTGKYMTVWVKETGNPETSHTVITFRLPGQAEVMFEAGGGGNSGKPIGEHPLRNDLTTSFKPRHWPRT